MNRLTRRVLLQSALATGLAGCAGRVGTNAGTITAQPSASDGGKLIIGLTYVPDIQFAPFYVAQAQGLFEQAGLQVTLRHHGAQESLLGAVEAGDEHVVFAGGGEMLQAVGQGVAIRNFATIYQRYPAAIIVPAGSAINSVADLRGRTVGLPGEYGENWFYLLAALEEAGLAVTDLNIQSIGFTQHAALTGAKVDAVVGFTNSDLVRFQTNDFLVRTLGPADPPLVSLGLGGLAGVVAERARELADLVQVVAAGAQFCLHDPAQSVELAKQFVPTLAEPDQVANALATLQATTALYGDRFGYQDADRWAAMTGFFAAHRLTPRQVAAADVFTADIVGGKQSVSPR